MHIRSNRPRLSGGPFLSPFRPSSRFVLEFSAAKGHIWRPDGQAGPVCPLPARKGFIVSRHRFKVGQTVHLVPNRLERHVPAGAYTIQRALPDEGRDLQYRVKNVQDGHERVVSEAQLRPAEALTPHN